MPRMTDDREQRAPAPWSFVAELDRESRRTDNTEGRRHTRLSFVEELNRESRGYHVAEDDLPITHIEIMEQYGGKGILATADVELSGLFTIRNAKIKEDDYGLTVVMPRTKMSESGEYKDACFFANRSLREQFDHAVLKAYEQMLCMTEPGEEQEQTNREEQDMGEGGMGGISM